MTGKSHCFRQRKLLSGHKVKSDSFMYFVSVRICFIKSVLINNNNNDNNSANEVPVQLPSLRVRGLLQLMFSLPGFLSVSSISRSSPLPFSGCWAHSSCRPRTHLALVVHLLVQDPLSAWSTPACRWVLRSSDCSLMSHYVWVIHLWHCRWAWKKSVGSSWAWTGAAEGLGVTVLKTLSNMKKPCHVHISFRSCKENPLCFLCSSVVTALNNAYVREIQLRLWGLWRPGLQTLAFFILFLSHLRFWGASWWQVRFGETKLKIISVG